MKAIDLFCGCGGFSLGLHKADIETIAAIDSDSKAIATYKANFPNTPHIICDDLTKFTPTELAQRINLEHVDIIVGGPPCQGYSTVRQVDGSNFGSRLVEDTRRHLYRFFYNYVDFFKPGVFIIENVPGINTVNNGEYAKSIKDIAYNLGYKLLIDILTVYDFGIPQKRRRWIAIGIRNDRFCFAPQITPVIKKDFRLGHAIMDLPPVNAGGGTDPTDYDYQLRNNYTIEWGNDYLDIIAEIGKSTVITAHPARPHSDRDLRDFAKMEEGENAGQAMKRGVEFEFPYDKSTFKDRYSRQSRYAPCSTITAHMSKDGLMYIHPTQNRSLTPREAARIQTFPDWFEFPVARTHQYN